MAHPSNRKLLKNKYYPSELKPRNSDLKVGDIASIYPNYYQVTKIILQAEDEICLTLKKITVQNVETS